jgi:uncharacterized repeat protein (TIGR04052 family)
MTYRLGRWLACAGVVAALSGCDDDGGTDKPGDGGSADADVEQRDITLQFEARVGSELARCDKTYVGLGKNKRDTRFADLRWYVYDVQLIDAGGKAVRVNLPDDEVFQWQQVGLLDFEDKSAECSNGSAETNHTLKGRVPVGDYRGLQFSIGMPPALSHGNPAEQKSPLTIQALAWSWRLGHKYLRIDLDLQAAEGLPPGGFEVHLGATGCTGTQGNYSCTNDNLPSVKLDAFDVDRDKIVLDVAALIDGVELKQGTTPGVPGCTSEPDDPDCEPIFESFGLALSTGQPGPSPQRIFSVEAR